MEEKMNYEFGSSADSVFSGFGSSSGLNTPAGSDLDSIESDQDDFMAELTRQMAENMLSEDDDKLLPTNSVSDTTEYYQQQKKPHNHHQQKNKDYGYGRRPGFVSGTHAGPGMRVVFLGGNGLKSGSPGTGVFLPHNISTNDNNPADHQYQYHKKTVCSTVLIPERVLQTLQQHFEKRNALPNSSTSNGRLISHTKSNQRLQSQKISKNNQELQLPQEWTY